MSNAEQRDVELGWINPNYVQVGRKDAARILGMSLAEFNRLRQSDPECPKGFRNHEGRGAKVRFRLADIYRYSEYRMSVAEEPASRE